MSQPRGTAGRVHTFLCFVRQVVAELRPDYHAASGEYFDEHSTSTRLRQDTTRVVQLLTQYADGFCRAPGSCGRVHSTTPELGAVVAESSRRCASRSRPMIPGSRSLILGSSTPLPLAVVCSVGRSVQETITRESFSWHGIPAPGGAAQP